MISKQLIEKYFRDQCNADERKQISDWLNAHPEELDKYLNEAEWEAFSAPAPDEPGRRTSRSVIIRLFSNRWMQAACLLVLLSGGWLLLQHKQQPAAKQLCKGPHPAPVLDSLQHIRNITRDKITTVLPDASTIELYPESEIAYTFQQDRRTVYLSGKASFSVEKDPTRPFTVASDQLTTTVLGTVFTVSNFKADNTIRIHLMAGKVMVSRPRTNSGDSGMARRLQPQDLLIFNKQNHSVSIIRQTRPANAPSYRGLSPSLPNWYMFDEQSLDQVFDQLSVYYGVDIDYYPSDIRKCFFTGKYDQKDSLETILHDIGLLNHLSITRSEKGYEVRKLNSN